MQEQQSLNSLLFNISNNCLLVEVSNNEIFDFLTRIRAFPIFVNGGSMTNKKVYQGFHDGKKVEEHCLTFVCVHVNVVIIIHVMVHCFALQLHFTCCLFHIV